MNTIYWLLGYEDEIEADERQKHLKYLACRQIEESKLKLKSVNNVKKVNKIENKIEYKNRFHNKHIDVNRRIYEMKKLNKKKT